MHREKASIKSLMDAVREIMSNVEFAIASYVKLRPWFVSRGPGIANTGLANHAGSAGTPPEFSYYGPVRRPSIFMQHMVDRFEKQVEECCKLIGELEQLVHLKNNKTYPASESLPKVLSNIHDYFIYVASKVIPCLATIV
jgi:nucleoporin p58/p45